MHFTCQRWGDQESRRAEIIPARRPDDQGLAAAFAGSSNAMNSSFFTGVDHIG